MIFATAWAGSQRRTATRSLVTTARTSHCGSDTPPQAVQHVRSLMRQEQACCAFLSFEMHEQPGEVTLTVKAPEQARAAIDELFEPFLSTKSPPQRR